MDNLVSRGRQPVTTDLDEIMSIAKILAMSGYFDVAKDMNVAVAQLTAKILAGRELGYGPWTSIQEINIVFGKPELSANLLAAAVKSHPEYDYRIVKLSNEIASIEFFEKGVSVGISSFSIDDARSAGLSDKNPSYHKYPRNMLFARAMSNGVRWFCPNVFGGVAVYATGELDDIPPMPMRIPTLPVSTAIPSFESPPSASSAPQAGLLPEPPPVPSPAPSPPPASASAPTHVSAQIMGAFHGIGQSVYGDTWDEERHRLCGLMTRGASTSSKDLTVQQLHVLSRGMVKKALADTPDGEVMLPEGEVRALCLLVSGGYVGTINDLTIPQMYGIIKELEAEEKQQLAEEVPAQEAEKYLS